MADPNRAHNRARITPSIVVSAAALIVAASSGAYAASGLITGSGIARETITTRNVKDGSLRAADLSPAARAQLRGPAGPAGPAGLAGLAGAQGPAGGFDPAKVSYVLSPQTVLLPGDIRTVVAQCPAGATAIGGGHFSINNNFVSSATPDRTGWQVAAGNDTTITTTVAAFAVCAAP